MSHHYLPPGLPPPPSPAPTGNTYLTPSAIAQQLIAPPAPLPRPPQDAAGNGHDDRRHCALLNEWRRRHGSDWVRADDLAPTVCCMIDPQGRIPAIRQRLRQLVASCSELETTTTGNAARRVVLYRLTEVESAGLEG